MDIQQQRDKLYLQLIIWLNRQGLQGTRHIFNCGDLGFVHIYWWGSGWQHHWFEPEPIPNEVLQQCQS